RRQEHGAEVIRRCGGRIQSICASARELGHPRAARRDIDRDRPVRINVKFRIREAVISSAVRSGSTGPEEPYYFYRLLHAILPLSKVGPALSDGYLVHRLARAEPEVYASRMHGGHGGEGLRNDGRVVAVDRCRYAGPDPDAGRPFEGS